MKFDEHGRLLWTPNELFQIAQDNRRRLIDHYLMRGTPAAFPAYAAYCDFLSAISERIGVHPGNLFLRGSCQVGFSIAPRVDKVWAGYDERSDLDLAIVDADYFDRVNHHIIQWEQRNRAGEVQGRASEQFAARQQDRFYNCCRVVDLPPNLCTHHFDAMKSVADMRHSGLRRTVKAFIFRDWWSVRSRYEYDLKKLREGVDAGRLPEPGDLPIRRLKDPK